MEKQKQFEKNLFDNVYDFKLDKEKEKENNVKKFFEKINLDINKTKKLNESNLNINKEENQINHIKKNILLVKSGKKTHIKRKDLILDIKDQTKILIKKIEVEEIDKRSNGKYY